MAHRTMADAKTLTFYLYPDLRKQAQRGRFNFVNRIQAAVEPLGYKVRFRGGAPGPRMQSADDPGYALFHMEEPFHDRALTMRRVYHAPFWAIEPTSERWRWALALEEFEPDNVDPEEAQPFVDRWRRKLFSAHRGDVSGHIYVPLQGRIRRQRSFQLASPLQMLDDVLQHAEGQPVIATLHPGETYSAGDRAALETRLADFPNLSLHSGREEEFLKGAEFVVTQNSSSAFNGYFFRKPVILYAKIDFHHIALSLTRTSTEQAFAAVRTHRPDFDAYLYWFWQMKSINAGRPDAEEKILTAFARGGWDL